jgi:hypothetical protein
MSADINGLVKQLQSWCCYNKRKVLKELHAKEFLWNRRNTKFAFPQRRFLRWQKPKKKADHYPGWKQISFSNSV